MPIDARIPLGVQPVQIQSPLNSMLRYQQVQAQTQAMQNNALLAQKAQREMQADTQLRNAFAERDPTLREQLLSATPEGATFLRTQRKDQGVIDLNDAKTRAAKLALHREWLSGVTDQESWSAARAMILADTAPGQEASTAQMFPEQYDQETVDRLRLTAKEQIDQTYKNAKLEIDRGKLAEQKRGNDIKANKGSKPVVVNDPTLGPVAVTYDPTTGQASYVRPVDTTGLNVSDAGKKQAAVGALSIVGYDPDTGEDQVTQLLPKSTSGGVETAGQMGAQGIGVSTEGGQASETLAQIAASLVYEMAHGKLGTGMSEGDRQLIERAASDMSNTQKPWENRKASWVKAREVLIRNSKLGESMAPKPKKEPAKQDDLNRELTPGELAEYERLIAAKKAAQGVQ